MTDSESGPAGEGDGDAGERDGNTGESEGDAGERDGDTGESEGDAGKRLTHAVILDFLPHGNPDDERPQYQKEPLAYAVGEGAFRLYELTIDEEADVSIGDRLPVDPASERDAVTSAREIEYGDLSRGANQELEYVVEEIVEREAERFVDFYNDAQPITLRLHQLNLLPGIGKKLRNKLLEQRKRGPFESFEDIEDRVSGLHNPKDVIVDRIMEELRDEDLKYKTFVGREPEE